MLQTEQYVRVSPPVKAVQVVPENIEEVAELITARLAETMHVFPKHREGGSEMMFVDGEGNSYTGVADTVMFMPDQQPQTVALVGDGKVITQRVVHSGAWFPVELMDWIVEEYGWYSIYSNEDFIKFFVKMEQVLV